MFSYLHKFCSEEVKLILARMDAFPHEFISDDLSRIDGKNRINKTIPPWRGLIEYGTYSIMENIVLSRRLFLLDKKNTKAKIYEIFTQCNSSP